tara:strand:- start:245 stop:436 length:192 start_codon:yes stop_codon:yes gene_type:complete
MSLGEAISDNDRSTLNAASSGSERGNLKTHLLGLLGRDGYSLAYNPNNLHLTDYEYSELYSEY